MRTGVRRTIALETKDEKAAIQKALEIADDPALCLGGSIEGEIEAFIAFKVDREEFTRFSAENKRLTLRRFARWIGLDVDLPKIRPENIDRFYREERKRVAESTIQGYMMCLRSFFSWLAKERKVIGKNPTDGLDMARWDYGFKEKYCTPELRDKFLNYWRHIPCTVFDKEQARELGFIAHAGFETGLRRNEIIEARPEWFSTKTRAVYVAKTPTFRPKDREDRSIPLTDVFLGFLEERPPTGTWCIASEKERGKSRYRYDFSVPFKKYCGLIAEDVGEDLSWVTPHIMRHTFGSLLAIAGESLIKISDWMGDDPRVTERHYLHFLEGDQAINRLHSFLPTEPPVSEHRNPPSKSVSNKRGTRRNRKASTGEIRSLPVANPPSVRS